jgi:dihydroflavonol-4-reductase
MSSSKLVFLTGATGFIGRHTVTALQQSGYKVRALCRSDSTDLSDQGVDVRIGDITRMEDVRGAMDGCSIVLHAAGAVSREGPDTRRMMNVHVQGTRHVMAAAIELKVSRIVHLSSSGTLAVGSDASMVYQETDDMPIGVIHKWPYYLSKLLAERAAFDAIRCASQAGPVPELVVLNPSLALGPGDARGSSTGDVARFLQRQIPVIPSGGLSFVDVRDIASAMVAAIERGRDKERYLLGAINLTMENFFQRLEEVSGVQGCLIPIRVPGKLAKLGVGVLGQLAKTLGGEAPVSTIDADMASHFWYVDSRKAEEELGFSPRDPMQTLLDTVHDIQGKYQSAKVVAHGIQ